METVEYYASRSIWRLSSLVAYFLTALFCITSAIFIFSFFNVRTLCIGWLATSCYKETGLAAVVIDCGNGGLTCLASDRGSIEANGAYADGLDLLHSKLEPIFEIYQDVTRPTYPSPHLVSPWKPPVELFGVKVAMVDKTKLVADRPGLLERYRGMQVNLPIVYLMAISSIGPIIVFNKNRSNIKIARDDEAGT